MLDRVHIGHARLVLLSRSELTCEGQLHCGPKHTTFVRVGTRVRDGSSCEPVSVYDRYRKRGRFWDVQTLCSMFVMTRGPENTPRC